MKKTRILVIDDEMSIVRYLSASLRRQDYEVMTAPDGEEGLRLAERENPNLVILDVKMPRVDGFETCRRLREWSQVPVIMLSAVHDREDKVKCLNLGADDYVTKPFDIEELGARIKAVLRRTQASSVLQPPSPFVTGDLSISFAERRVTVDGAEVRLTPTEFNLLQELVVNSGRVLTHVHLLNAVWGAEYREETDYLHVFIGRLRRKIEPDRTETRHIVTVPGVGYQWK